MRNFLVPEFWVTAKISGDALRTAVAVGLHRGKEGYSYVKNEQLIVLVGKNIRQIQVDLSNCEKAGLITKKFDETGKRYFIINMIKSTGAVGQHPAQPDNATPRSENAPPSAVRMRPPAQSECTPRRSATALPPNNPPIGIQSTFQSTTTAAAAAAAAEGSDRLVEPLEPFEAGMVPSSPPIRVRPIETRQPIRFESPDLGEMKNRFYEVLGPYAEPIYRKISHAQIESGFVAWLLEECAGADTPFRLFQHKLKTDWQGGNWTRPEDVKRLAKAEKQRKHEDFLRSLT